jgi:hypothetical protein
MATSTPPLAEWDECITKQRLKSSLPLAEPLLDVQVEDDFGSGVSLANVHVTKKYNSTQDSSWRRLGKSNRAKSFVFATCLLGRVQTSHGAYMTSVDRVCRSQNEALSCARIIVWCACRTSDAIAGPEQ